MRFLQSSSESIISSDKIFHFFAILLSEEEKI